MFREGPLDRTLRAIKRLIPKPLFDAGAKVYHPMLAFTGALRYGFPSRRLTVIGVTGTKGKSTTVFMLSRIFEDAGHPCAAIGSLGYKIRDREWPNLLKMTMPGRWKMQKFLREAVNAGCTHTVIECPSEGLAQHRHLGVTFAAAVFLNLHAEHLEAHGSWDAYRAAKQMLFRACRGIHIINADDPSASDFLKCKATKRITFGIASGDVMATDVVADAHGSSFRIGKHRVRLLLGGRFNVVNALAALTVADAFGIPIEQAALTLGGINDISGRMEWVQREPFGVVVDYAHTPDSLRMVYETLKPQGTRLLCVLGAAGGGRDTWKRPKFGALAEQYCDRIFLTNEDPYDQDPDRIVSEIQSGMTNDEGRIAKCVVEMDRRKAIAAALTEARAGDIVVITGKGSETSMALAGGRKIPWSDRTEVQTFISGGR
jgi:UDP-N-acetylmuramoyl-L-alanyl-D-glutamate--2,6-diaminopimelate ligase